MNIEQIRARLSLAKENVKRDPFYVSTRVYIADVEELLEEVDRAITAETELAATQKQLEAAVGDIEYLITHPEAPAEKLCAHWNKYCTGCCCFHGKNCKPEWRGERSGENE